MAASWRAAGARPRALRRADTRGASGPLDHLARNWTDIGTGVHAAGAHEAGVHGFAILDRTSVVVSALALLCFLGCASVCRVAQRRSPPGGEHFPLIVIG